jgi:hypothetical protein
MAHSGSGRVALCRRLHWCSPLVVPQRRKIRRNMRCFLPLHTICLLKDLVRASASLPSSSRVVFMIGSPVIILLNQLRLLLFDDSSSASIPLLLLLQSFTQKYNADYASFVH